MLWRILRSRQTRDLFFALALAAVTAGLMIFPRECMAAAKDGLALCGNVIVPTLFPFFVLSSLVVDLGLASYLGRALEPVMRPLFRVNGSCAAALALGFIGGYPVGARTAIALYGQGQCSRTEAQRLLAFCNNSGPAFILGVVGAGVFQSGTLGILLYLTHILASCLVGVIFRFYGPRETGAAHAGAPTFQVKRFTTAFTQAVTGGMTSTLNICAFVLFFTVLLRLLTLSGIIPALAALAAALGFETEAATQFLVGLVELSSGVAGLTGGHLARQATLAAFMLGWAGLSIHCQTLTFLADSGLSPGTYFVGKLLHGGISAALVQVLARLLPQELPVSAVLADRVDAIATLDFSTALTASVVAAWCLLLVFFFFSIFCGKNQKRVV